MRGEGIRSFPWSATYPPLVRVVNPDRYKSYYGRRRARAVGVVKRMKEKI